MTISGTVALFDASRGRARDSKLFWFDQIADASSAKATDSLSGDVVSTPSS
jgi:hypothetical protein